MRKSIEALKAESPVPSSGADDSRRPSFSSRRTLSQNLSAFASASAGPSTLRPPPADSRARSNSMDLLNHRESIAGVIGRSTSVPLQNDGAEWDAYIRERKLLQPPSGVSPPIPTSPVTLASPKPRLAVPSAVTDALLKRQKRESSLSFSGLSPTGSPEPLHTTRDTPEKRHSATKERSPDELPVALRPPQHKKSDSQGSYAPGVILPPRNRNGSSPQPQPQSRPDPARVMSMEELEGRHRERLRNMQQPLTQAEKDHADTEAARSRWERAKQLEKQAVTKRQAEQAAFVSRKEKEEKKRGTAGEPGRQNSVSLNDDPKAPRRQTRSLSQDVLASAGQQQQGSTSSRRLSHLKVEDWQKNQVEDLERGMRPRVSSSSRRLSGVPFPADSGPVRASRESRRLSGMILPLARDPPS